MKSKGLGIWEIYISMYFGILCMDLGNLCIWGVLGKGCHLLTMPKYLFFTELLLETISSLTSDLKKLIYEWSNFRFTEGVVPLNYVKILV